MTLRLIVARVCGAIGVSRLSRILAISIAPSNLSRTRSIQAILRSTITRSIHDRYWSADFRAGFGRVYEVPATLMYVVCSALLASLPFLQDFRTMAPQQKPSQIPKVQFRVLIVGRANSGKTTILKRVCETTESPKIYRRDQSGQRSQVRSHSWRHPQSHRLVRFNSKVQLRLDSMFCWQWLDVTVTIVLAAWPPWYRWRTDFRKTRWLYFPRLSWIRVW